MDHSTQNTLREQRVNAKLQFCRGQIQEIGFGSSKVIVEAFVGVIVAPYIICNEGPRKLMTSQLKPSLLPGLLFGLLLLDKEKASFVLKKTNNNPNNNPAGSLDFS